MSIESAESNIRNARRQIEQYEQRISQLRRDIGKLEGLENQYRVIENELQQRSQASIQQVRKLSLLGNPLRLVKSYSESMEKLFEGGRFYEALDGFQESRRVVLKKIMELEWEIQNLANCIRSCEGQIRSGYAEIAEIREKEAAENGE